MPVERRSRRLFVLTLAVPIIVAVYLAAFAGRVWSALRPSVALALGASVIGSVYVEEAWRRSPTPRVSPLRAAAVLALALIVAGAGLPASPTRAASPSEAAIAAAQGYIGTPYRLGATGPARFDCSGLMFRIFADIGELPRIGGKRMRAVQYYNWFKARGMITTSPSSGDRGDLVYYSNGHHIGIYLGNGRVLSAMASGVKVHGLQAISSRFVAFLKVNWSEGDPAAGGEGAEKPKKNKKKKNNETPPAENKPGDGDTTVEQPTDTASGPRGRAIGTMNLRNDADPGARIIGWVRRGSSFEILGTGNSPSGALWYNVKLRSGKTGWVWSRWVQPLDN
jgi:cell wall-associated NlpC family hydrolase